MRNRLKKVCPPLLPIFVILMAGIGTGRCPPLTSGWFGLCAGACIFLILLFYFFRFSRLIILLCISAFAWGVWTMDRTHRPRLPEHHTVNYADGSRYWITGRIASFAKHYPNKAAVALDCQEIRREDARAVAGRIRLSVYGSMAEILARMPSFGARIRFYGPLHPIRNYANPGGYDYEAHLRYQGIFGSSHTSMAKIQLLDQAEPPSLVLRFLRGAEALRNRFWMKVTGLGSGDGAGEVLGALVTGKKESLPPGIRENFSRAGTAHLLAISGFHLSLVALGFFFVFNRVLLLIPCLAVSGRARKLAGLITLIPLAGYAVFTGFSPSTQRALIMVVAFMAALGVERGRDPLNTLCLAGILILVFDPAALFSISFQLSFAAVAFIILGINRVYQAGWMPDKKWYAWAAGLFWVSLFAGLGTWPLIVRYFNTLSYVQVASNMIVVPVIGFLVLPLGFAGLLLTGVFPGGASWILDRAVELAGLCIRYIEFITGFQWSWGRTVTPDAVDLTCIYIAMGALCFLWARWKRAAVVLLAVVVAAGTVSVSRKLVQRFNPGRMTMTVLDAGQSTTIVVLTPEGGVILVDCGGFGGGAAFDPGRFIVGPFLWRHWIKRIDAVILTHPESDHMNGLVFIMENFTVGQWIRNRDVGQSRVLGRLENTAARRGIPQCFPEETIQRFEFDRVVIDLFPRYGLRRPGDLNNNSLVCRLEYGEVSILFPGDIEAERELDLVRTHGHRLASDVLLAPHHGSRSSSSKIFLDQIRPEEIIISCGYNNRYGFPHPETLARYRENGAKTLRTDLLGAVVLTSSGKGYDINTQRKH